MDKPTVLKRKTEHSGGSTQEAFVGKKKTSRLKYCLIVIILLTIGLFDVSLRQMSSVKLPTPMMKDASIGNTYITISDTITPAKKVNVVMRVSREVPGSAVINDMKYYVCPTFGPRLGNLMFLYATNYGVAFDNNKTLALQNQDYIYQTFNIPRPRIQRYKVCNGNMRSFNQRRPRYFQKFNIPKYQNVRLSGYLQSWKYFANSFDDLRHQFIFKQKYVDEAARKINELVNASYPGITSQNVTTVGIHIRRGDYVAEKRPMADLTYIESAKEYFLKNYSNVLFIVATNDDKEAKTWCTKNVINGSGKSVFAGFNHRFVDMAILSKCDHIIISTGTYGWWAAFLNKGTVIHYDWIPPNHYKFNRNDYILPSWIGIKSTTKYKATRN